MKATMVAKQDPYWPGQIEIQRLATDAWIAHAEKRDDDALRLMRESADLESSTEKHPVTPGALLPARGCAPLSARGCAATISFKP